MRVEVCKLLPWTDEKGEVVHAVEVEIPRTNFQSDLPLVPFLPLPEHGQRELPAMPKRIQRERTAGWRMPANAIYVGRPTIWGNWARGQDAVEAYRAYLRTMVLGERGNFLWRAGGVEIAGTYYRVEVLHRPTWKEIDELRERLPELRGHDLCCWCGLDKPCHADPLLDVANKRGDQHGSE